jgi:hypothetical protein
MASKRRSMIGLAVVILIGSSPMETRSEPKTDVSYLCTSQVTAGISFNDQEKRWVSTDFSKNEEFVLKIKHLGKKTRKLPGITGIKWSVATYTVSLTKQGENEPTICLDHSNEIAWVIDALDDLLQCVTIAGNTHFQFNLKTNRFLKAYLGYAQAKDNNDDTAAITAGACTKIN